jgi:hypothetical protein
MYQFTTELCFAGMSVIGLLLCRGCTFVVKFVFERLKGTSIGGWPVQPFNLRRRFLVGPGPGPQLE